MRRGTDKFEEGDFAKIFFGHHGISRFGIMNKSIFYEVGLNDSKEICFYGENSDSVENKKISQIEFLNQFRNENKSLTNGTRNLDSLESLFLLKDLYKFNKKIELLDDENYKKNLDKIHGSIEVPSSIYFIAKNNCLSKKEYFGIIAGQSDYSESTIKNILADKKILDSEYGIVHRVPTENRASEIIKIIEENSPYYLGINLEK